MAFEGVCPYFVEERGKYLYCKMCRFKYPSKAARREHAYKYCASIDGFEKCNIKKVLDKEYERKGKERQE